MAPTSLYVILIFILNEALKDDLKGAPYDAVLFSSVVVHHCLVQYYPSRTTYVSCVQNYKVLLILKKVTLNPSACPKMSRVTLQFAFVMYIDRLVTMLTFHN